MVNENFTATEQKIIEAAQLEFSEKGLSGARMQSIADKAGINKALLHYYYRSKDKLFEVVFKMLFRSIIPRVEEILNKEIDLFEKIRIFVETYINLIQSSPQIPMFIMHELSSNPKRLSQMVALAGLNVEKSPLKKQLDELIASGKIRPIEIEQLMINILSLCIFPIVAKPISMTVLYNGDEKAYQQMIEMRKKSVAEFVINAIKNTDYEELT